MKRHRRESEILPMPCILDYTASAYLSSSPPRSLHSLILHGLLLSLISQFLIDFLLSQSEEFVFTRDKAKSSTIIPSHMNSTHVINMFDCARGIGFLVLLCLSTLEQAVINNRLIRNPLRGVKLPSVTKKEIDILSAEEQALLHSAASSSSELPAFGIIFTLSTGVRLGELIGFQWGDINVKSHSIRVRRTVGRLQKVDEDGNLFAKEPGKASWAQIINFAYQSK